MAEGDLVQNLCYFPRSFHTKWFLSMPCLLFLLLWRENSSHIVGLMKKSTLVPLLWQISCCTTCLETISWITNQLVLCVNLNWQKGWLHKVWQCVFPFSLLAACSQPRNLVHFFIRGLFLHTVTSCFAQINKQEQEHSGFHVWKTLGSSLGTDSILNEAGVGELLKSSSSFPL